MARNKKAKDLARKLYQQGITTDVIASSCQVSRRTIQRWILDFQKASASDQAKILANTIQISSLEVKPDAKKKAKVKQEPEIEVNVKPQVENKYLDDAWTTRLEMRKKELNFLNHLQEVLLKQLNEEPGVRIIDRLIKLSERRCKLLGLDAKNMEILEAFTLLAQENFISPQLAAIAYEHITAMEQDLKDCFEQSND